MDGCYDSKIQMFCWFKRFIQFEIDMNVHICVCEIPSSPFIACHDPKLLIMCSDPRDAIINVINQIDMPVKSVRISWSFEVPSRPRIVAIPSPEPNSKRSPLLSFRSHIPSPRQACILPLLPLWHLSKHSVESIRCKPYHRNRQTSSTTNLAQ